MGKFKKFLENREQEQQKKIEQLWNQALSALTGSLESDEALHHSLGDMKGQGGAKGAQVVQSKLGNVFNQMRSIPELAPNVDTTKRWLQNQAETKDGKAAPRGRTVADLLRVMFGDKFSVLSGTEEPEKPSTDDAKAQVEPQPPQDTTPPPTPPDPQMQPELGDMQPAPPIGDPNMPQPPTSMAAGGQKQPALNLAAHTRHVGKGIFEQWLQRRS